MLPKKCCTVKMYKYMKNINIWITSSTVIDHYCKYQWHKNVAFKYVGFSFIPCILVAIE